MIYVYLVGRIFFSAIFIIKGVEHFLPKMLHFAADHGVPMPTVLVPLAGVVVLLGGLSLLVGYKVKIGAWFLVAFLVPTTFMIHKFWTQGDFFGALMHEFCFWKNISMLGAALMFTHLGAGPLSVDSCCANKNMK